MFFSSSVRVLLEDFVLLGHISSNMPDHVGFIGQSSMHGLHVQTRNRARNTFVVGQRYGPAENDNAVNVISLGFSKEGASFLVTSLLGSESFKNVIQGSDGTRIGLPNSTAAPFMVTDPESMRPLIALPCHSKLKFFSVKNRAILEKQEYEIDTTVSSSHSSAFVDLSGDLRPNIALHTGSRNSNFLEIYNFHGESRQMVQRIALPANIGPLQYADLCKRQCYDLIYISIEGANSFINVHFNQNPPDLGQINTSRPWEYFDGLPEADIYTQLPNHKTDIYDLLEGTPVLRDKNNLPTGFFLADLASSGEMHLIITMNEFGTRRARCLRFADGKFELSPYDPAISAHKDVLSVSVSDVYGRGKEDLIINCMKNGVPTLVYQKIYFPIQNSKLSALTLYDRGKRELAYLPGATYLLLYDDGTVWRKASQLSATSYPSYQHQGSFIGLGQTNFFLTFVLARTNASCAVHDKRVVSNIIVPNTSIVLLASPYKDWAVRNYFLLNQYYVVTTSLLILMVGNVFVLLYLILKERRVLLRKEAEENYTRPVFSAL